MKKIFKGLIVGILMISLTGCLRKDELENITIYTTSYPIEYITATLYNGHGDIKSIYPDGTNIKKYELNDKQIKDFSKGNMYVFDGTSNEDSYVAKLFKNNKRLMIIDATQSIEYTYASEELWLNPSNFLMITRNIKTGLFEYVDKTYLKNEIEKNYEDLKIKISNIDANIKLIYENATHKTIVVDNDALKFLENYGFTVISLQDNNGINEKNLVDAKKLIEKKDIKYIFTLSGYEVNDTVASLVKDSKVELLEMNSLANLSDKQRSEQDDYLSLINENIEMLKKELY